MFREGYYIEIIKTKHCAATAVITIEEKTVQTRRRKISTNKWLDLEDWSALYDVLTKALVLNDKHSNWNEKRHCTKHLKIVYSFEPAEEANTRLSLPTVRVRVSPLKKKSRPKAKEVQRDERVRSKSEAAGSSVITPKVEELQFSCCDPFEAGFNNKVEEYIPNVPNLVEKNSTSEEKLNLKYIPSRKSALESTQQLTDSNEYVPTIVKENTADQDCNALYIPNSIPKSTTLCETYEPSSSASLDTGEKYIPNSKGIKKKVEEYQPDFTSKTMKFDDSYVPSSSQKIKEFQKSKKKLSLASKKSSQKESEKKRKESSSKTISPVISSSIRREI